MYERTASGALASGQLEYLSCVWQNLSPPLPIPPLTLSLSLSLPLLYASPLHRSPPLLFHRLSHSGPATLRFIGLATPPDTRHVWVRMFGYAKCSRASQVECLMALFCLNTEPDANGERTGVFGICIRTRIAPNFPFPLLV